MPAIMPILSAVASAAAPVVGAVGAGANLLSSALTNPLVQAGSMLLQKEEGRKVSQKALDEQTAASRSA